MNPKAITRRLDAAAPNCLTETGFPHRK